MSIKRTMIHGVVLATLIVGTNYTTYSFQKHAQKEDRERYDKYIGEMIERLTEKDRRILGLSEELGDLKIELDIYKDTNEDLKKEINDLKKQLKEAKTITTSRGETGGIQMTVEATAYTPYCTGCSGITATGIDVRNNITYNGLGIVATDPKVIPLGSTVVINGKKYIAADTGGAIKGNKIDILVRTKKEAYEFGRRNITITVFKNN